MGVIRYLNGVQSTVSTLSQSVIIAADRVNASVFYAADTNHFYISTDKGATFTTASSISNSDAVKIAVHPSVAGDVWFSTSSGLYHSTNYGSTFTQISGVTTSYAIALGKGAGTYPNIYGFVTTATSGGNALQMSADQGVTWTKISDSTHGFGSSSSDCLTASQDTEGLVFVGTNGRGIFYGLPSGTSTTTTSATSIKSTTSTSSKATSTSSVKVTTSSTIVITTSVISATSTKTTLATSTTSTSAGGSIAKYAQCGGTGWTGSGACVAGTTCTEQNAFYYQCL